MSYVEQAFESLWYGAGSWLGLLLYLTFCLTLQLKFKQSGVVLIPIGIMIIWDYLSQNLQWHALIIGTTTILIFLLMVNQVKGT